MEQDNPKFFILDIDSKYNDDLFPLTINDDEIINLDFKKYDDCKFERSQYSLEITLYNLFKKHSNLTYDYKTSDVVFIPIFTFLTGWKTKYYYSVEDIIENLKEITPLIDKVLNDGKKVIMVYSDVMWEDERCFINHFNFGKNVYFVCYESVTSINNQIVVPYCTHIKCDPSKYKIPINLNKKELISYAGRTRKELNFFKNIKILNTSKENTNHWISSNNKDLYNQIDELYLNSYFSLQPHGDKQSRKGFYHSLLLGCVPVIFEDNFHVYENVFHNISEISVILKHSDTNDYENILKRKIDDVESIINKIDKIKNLLLYDEHDLCIVDYILNKLN